MNNPVSAEDSVTRMKKNKTALMTALCEAGARESSDEAHWGCPFHGADQHGSLSIFEQKGIWFFKCHGCEKAGTIIDVVMYAEMIDATAATKAALEQYGNIIDDRRPIAGATEAWRPTFASWEEVAATVSKQAYSCCTRADHYCDANGKHVFTVLRFDRMDGKGKTFRPVHQVDGGGWVMGDPPGLLPLFNLYSITQSPTLSVIVCEGEKAASAFISLGFLATTSAHGSKSAAKTDWTPLAGRFVTIWPDNDDAGLAYADNVTEILRKLNPPAIVKVVDPKKQALPIPAGGDVVDVLEGITK
jgi:hypothetical protein